MKTNPGIILDNTSRDTFSLSVYSIEKISGGFIIHPVGPLDLNSYVILEKKMELILLTQRRRMQHATHFGPLMLLLLAAVVTGIAAGSFWLGHHYEGLVAVDDRLHQQPSSKRGRTQTHCLAAV